MKHFANDNKMNIFRLPVGWQYLTNSKVGGDLDPDQLGKYDELVGACLNTGASCIIDIHNCKPPSSSSLTPHEADPAKRGGWPRG